MATLREQAIISIQKLPENASADDIIDSVILAEKVNTAINELDSGKGIPDSEMKKIAAEWAAK
ncbi:MAG: hypothetical protein K8S54_21320 [Spirochaetia bacterium]|nr:hypothetical protein [Spirochaetia bacterium]